MNYLKTAAILVLASGSMAWSKPPVQTTEWFKEHKAEREAVIADCLNRRAEIANDNNCLNAIRANELAKLSGKRMALTPLTSAQIKTPSGGAVK